MELKYTVNATDEEIREWMDAEIARLGEWFDHFLITWHRTGNYCYGQLYLWSESKYDYGKLNHPFGRGLMLGEAYDTDGLYLPAIQEEGRKLYYRLKNDYHIRRDLGRN